MWERELTGGSGCGASNPGMLRSLSRPDMTKKKGTGHFCAGKAGANPRENPAATGVQEGNVAWRTQSIVPWGCFRGNHADIEKELPNDAKREKGLELETGLVRENGEKG